MASSDPDRLLSPAVQVFRFTLLAIWAAVSFGVCFFARDLQFVVAGWPLHYWIAAQGAVLVFIGVVALYAMVMNRLDPDDPPDEDHA